VPGDPYHKDGHPRWWGGVVSGILQDNSSSTPDPSLEETRGPLPASSKVVCRILFTMVPGSLDPSRPAARALVEGTSQKVCQSLAILNAPLSIMAGESVASVCPAPSTASATAGTLRLRSLGGRREHPADVHSAGALTHVGNSP
jgi:hypothetical protein